MSPLELDVWKSAPERSRVKHESKLARKIKEHKRVRKFIADYTPIIFILVLILIALIVITNIESLKNR
jgi:predicted nucleic acid-binding Zn ribbon protein